MLIAVARAEHLPEWLYPYRVAPFSGASLRAEYLDGGLDKLWKALGRTSSYVYKYVSTHCTCGFPHNAPERLFQLDPEFVEALAALPESEMWRVALAWTTAELGHRPNDAQLQKYKAWLRELSAFSQQAVANAWLVVMA